MFKAAVYVYVTYLSVIALLLDTCSFTLLPVPTYFLIKSHNRLVFHIGNALDSQLAQYYCDKMRPFTVLQTTLIFRDNLALKRGNKKMLMGGW